MTSSALAALSRDDVWNALARHARQDWGDVDPEDAAANDAAFRDGDRILSVYHTPARVKFWIITEADRSATTVLMPDDY